MVSEIIVAGHIITTETPIITVGSETPTMVIKIIRGIRTAVDSETRTAAAIIATADSETKAAVTRIIRGARTTAADSEIRTAAATVDSEILKAPAPDRNLPAVSETAQAAKAMTLTDRAADEASDKIKRL